MRDSLKVKERGALYGVYRAVVVDGDDAAAPGHVKVNLATLDVGEASARLAVWHRPDPGNEVLIAFEGGDLRYPYVVGPLWSADGSPPPVRDVTTGWPLSVNAPTVKVTAGSVEVNAGMSRFAGVVQADTLIANSVVASSYTPGAGNIA